MVCFLLKKKYMMSKLVFAEGCKRFDWEGVTDTYHKGPRPLVLDFVVDILG